MIQWFEKQLISKMERLNHAAQMIVFVHILDQFELEASLLAQLGLKGIEPNKVEPLRGFYAAAIANYLFGKQAAEQHKEIFDLGKIEKIAIQWLRRENDFQELVVQSVRVSYAIGYAKNQIEELSLHQVLAEFGKKFPEAPNPASYEKLVDESLSLLSPGSEEKVREWMKNHAQS